MTDLALRKKLIETALRMNALGINQGRSGNLSVRSGNGLLITPSGVAYDGMQAADIVAMRFDGTWGGALKPSSEWHFHLGILKARPDAGAVLHAHSSFATAIACLHRDIPAFHYMVAVAGGNSIRCAPYATFGTDALSNYAIAALDGRRACLLANHGMIVLGADLDAALDLAVEVETLAEQYWRALQIGDPVILADDEMDRVLKKFETYGVKDGNA